MSLHTPRLLVQVNSRQAVISSLHNIAHLGIRATKRLVTSSFISQLIGADIVKFCGSCQQCARSKVTSTLHTHVQTIELPVRRFSHVHVDLVGASSDGQRRLLPPLHNDG